MTTEQYRVANFRDDKRAIIDKMVEILAEYSDQKLSSRQVYYRFIGGNFLPDSWIDVEYNRKKGLPDDTKNTEKNYQRLISILVDARYAGLVDWDIIEDRGREPKVPGEWDNVDQIVDAALDQFRLPRRADQPRHLELWVEKDALAGVLGPIARRAHVALAVNKGYSSASAMKAAADRMIAACGVTAAVPQCAGCAEDFRYRYPDGTCKGCGLKKEGIIFRYNDEDGDQIETIEKDVVILYLGDHDPSGEDMVRDVRDRLTEFGVPNLEVVKIGLTIQQVRQYDLPPNPAKVNDSRAKAYIEKFGNDSWEVDAVPPRELNRIVEQAIAEYTDSALLNASIAIENAERERVRRAIQRSRRK